MTSKVLVGWLYARVCESLTNDRPLDPTTRESIPLIGKQLIHILMACRHKVSRNACLSSYKHLSILKGTVEAVHQSLQEYLTISEQLEQYLANAPTVNPKHEELMRSLLSELIRPRQVIDVCLAAVSDCKFSVTRRSAGLWPASKAALMAELTASPFDQVFAL